MKKLVALTALATVALSSAAFAMSDKDLLAKATVSLTDAIALAEKNQAGKATSADLTEEKDTPIWEIKLLNGDQEFDVKVNGATGTIIESKKD